MESFPWLKTWEIQDLLKNCKQDAACFTLPKHNKLVILIAWINEWKLYLLPE